MSSTPPRARIVILISGRGSNMRAIIEHSRAPDAPYVVDKVLSDRADAAGLSMARGMGIAADALPAGAAGRSAYEGTLAAAIGAATPLIVLAGFMRVLSPPFVSGFAGRILNIHPSLLPNYPGLHTHRRALAAGEAQHGATVHFVTETLDGGPPVIQARVPVEPGDDESSLAARVQVAEHRIYPLAVRWFCEGRLRFNDARAWLDGVELREPIQC